ncbi:MAG: ArsR/SmtB family transcription factor [Ancrocorticia sp.]|uniref:ArsR/SmtB family transcription factor n=1 Tax=Ancrocorticia sp. TaxID=2593684 RepID=UPI003F91AD23
MALEESTMTTAMLKAMSNPLRRQILTALNRYEYARAADLATDLEVPANKLSFHLRVLADAGLIKEAPEQARDRRDRVWTTVTGSQSLGSPTQPVADEALGLSLLQVFAEEHRQILDRLVAWAPEYVAGRDPEIHGTFARSSVFLTPDQFRELLEKLTETLDEMNDSGDKSDPNRRLWQIDMVAADDQI